MNSTMNLEKDLIGEIHSIFNRHGIRYKCSIFQQCLVDFFSYNNRIIPARRRRINISNQIKLRIKSYPKAKDFLSLIYDAQTGSDLNIYQSETLSQLRFHDYLLNVWNIHHLHLSSAVDRKGKKKHGDDLVFVKITANEIYFLDFDKHANGVFGDEKWLQIIQENWPSTLKRYKGDERFEQTAQLEPCKRQQFWEKGYTLGMTNVNGTVYNDPGIGITSSGHSLTVILRTNNIHRWLHDCEKWLTDNESNINLELGNRYGDSAKPIDVKARIRNTIEIYDNTSGEILFTYDNK